PPPREPAGGTPHRGLRGTGTRARVPVPFLQEVGPMSLVQRVPRTRSRVLPPALAVLVALAVVPHARASEEALRKAVAPLAEQVVTYLKGTKQATVTVGNFPGPDKLRATSGPAVKKAVMEELEQRGIKHSTRASLTLKGEYRPTPKSDKLGVIVEAR